jgi:hypothetical protein
MKTACQPPHAVATVAVFCLLLISTMNRERAFFVETGRQTLSDRKKRNLINPKLFPSNKNEFVFVSALKMTKSNSRIRHSLNIHNFLIASRAASRDWNKLRVIGLLFVLILINLHLELSSSFG